jgi:hypothetical protein
MEKLNFQVPMEMEGERLDVFINEWIDTVSRSYLQKLIKDNLVTVNGPLGTLSQIVDKNIKVTVENNMTIEASGVNGDDDAQLFKKNYWVTPNVFNEVIGLIGRNCVSLSPINKKTIMNITGLLVGFSTFLIIGLFHPLVIKAEYYIGVKSWVIFALVGVAFTICSLLVKGVILSTILGVVAFSSFWSILEVFEQRGRVRKGWFPEGPGHKK